MRAECNFKNGEYDGLFRSYQEDTGRLYEQFTFKEGKYDGPYEYYHDNGVRERLAVYKMGRILQGQEAAEYRKEWEAKQIKIPYSKFPNINDGR